MISISPVSPILRFDQPAKQARRYIISGVTQNSSNAPLASCTVKVIDSITGRIVGQTVSDANGLYSIDVTGTNEAGADYIATNGAALSLQVIATSSDGTQAGATVDTLTGTPG